MKNTKSLESFAADCIAVGSRAFNPANIIDIEFDASGIVVLTTNEIEVVDETGGVCSRSVRYASASREAIELREAFGIAPVAQNDEPEDSHEMTAMQELAAGIDLSVALDKQGLVLPNLTLEELRELRSHLGGIFYASNYYDALKNVAAEFDLATFQNTSSIICALDVKDFEQMYSLRIVQGMSYTHRQTYKVSKNGSVVFDSDSAHLVFGSWMKDVVSIAAVLKEKRKTHDAETREKEKDAILQSLARTQEAARESTTPVKELL